MLTRAEYMNKAVTHEQYYGQFVTPHVKSVVLQRIGLPAILASKDPYMNDIPLARWDGIIGWKDRPGHKLSTDLSLYARLKECGDFVSAGTLVCVMKAAARQIKEEHAAKEQAC